MNATAQKEEDKLQLVSDKLIHNVPLEKIKVLNPRSRNQQIFARLVENISSLGLKRPITVTSNGEGFDLICGQGRFEAFRALGETQIPCVIVSPPEADRYLISLIENLARRRHSNRDLLSAISELSQRGYSPKEISQKTSLHVHYIACILILLNQGEERLISAVERGWLPIKIAIEIAKSDDGVTQAVMLEAFESGLLKGDQLLKVRRLIEKRKSIGKKFLSAHPKTDRITTPGQLVKTYQQEVDRQKILIKKSEINEQRLMFIVTSIRKLTADEKFKALLQTESLTDMPAVLSKRVFGGI